MPRYYFHIYDDAFFRDDDGMDFADAPAARAAALAGARAMICDQVEKGRLNLHYRIEVECEEGNSILTLLFGDAIEIETAPA